MLAQQVPDAPTERETADAGGGDQPAGAGQAMGLGLVVEIAPGSAALGHRQPAHGVDLDGAHSGQVEHQTVVAGGETRDAVPAAPHGDRQALAARELNGPDHVGDPGGTHDERRVAVNRVVPDTPCQLVVRLARPDQDPRILPASSVIVASPNAWTVVMVMPPVFDGGDVRTARFAFP